jgi:hypothetical protein
MQRCADFLELALLLVLFWWLVWLVVTSLLIVVPVAVVEARLVLGKIFGRLEFAVVTSAVALVPVSSLSKLERELVLCSVAVVVLFVLVVLLMMDKLLRLLDVGERVCCGACEFSY